MFLSFFQTYRKLILQTSLTLLLTLVLTFLKIPILFFRGLYTYIHPENLGYNNASQSGVRAAIRRPTGSDSNSATPELKRRNKSKDKFEFDENSAQIFRLKLDEGHLQSRLLFNDYNSSFIFSFVAISSWALYKYLGSSGDSGILANGCLIPVVFVLVALTKTFISLAKVSFEKSASKRSEKHLCLVFGVLGFCIGIAIFSGFVPSVFDFDFGSLEGPWRVLGATLMGCLAGFLYAAAGKNGRSFWLGTDQLRCNLSIISCGWFNRLILYASFLLNAFTALLWINPFVQLLVNQNIANVKGARATVTSSGEADKLFGNAGLPHSEITRLRFLCLILSALLQIIALRPNLQMFLNEAVLSWYQRLHASKVPDLDFSRAKVFLHNHYLCLAVLQFFAPSALVLLLSCLAQIDVSSFDKHPWLCSLLPCSALVNGLPLFIAWWIVFLWAVYTSASLVFYRRGVLYVS